VVCGGLKGFGVIAALDDSPRPGREPVITDEAWTFVVDLACRKAKDFCESSESVTEAGLISRNRV